MGIGGVSNVIKNIINDSVEENFEFTIISLSNTPKQDYLVNYAFISFGIDEDSNYSLYRYAQYAIFKSITKQRYSEVINFINKLNPDIIHFHTNPRQLMIGHLVDKELRSRLLFTDHSLRLGSNSPSKIKRDLLGLVYKWYYKHFDVTAVSAIVFQNQQNFNLTNKNKKHILIENKIKPIGLKPTVSENGKIRFIYIARIHPNKGHDILIKAWKMVDSDIERELILIGPNIMGLKLNDKTIKFLGPLNKVDIWLQKADFGVFPSKKEGLPLALIEMLSMGLPVIVNNVPELTSIIKDGFNGLVYKRNDVLDLSNKIEILLMDNDYANRLARNAKPSVSGYVSATPGHDYIKLYKSYSKHREIRSKH